MGTRGLDRPRDLGSAHDGGRRPGNHRRGRRQEKLGGVAGGREAGRGRRREKLDAVAVGKSWAGSPAGEAGRGRLREKLGAVAGGRS
jgi:hypothetical protein